MCNSGYPDRSKRCFKLKDKDEHKAEANRELRYQYRNESSRKMRSKKKLKKQRNERVRRTK